MGGNLSKFLRRFFHSSRNSSSPVEIPLESTLEGIDLASERIDLRNRNFSILPDIITTLHQLTWLSISQNKLMELPYDIGNLSSLITLRIFSNLLEELPSDIQRLTKLTTLDIGKNRLNSLCPEIGSCTSLTDLNLQWNKISQLPPEIGNLVHLRTLNLYINNIQEFPHQMSNLIQLDNLDFAHNHFTTFPSLGKLNKLTTINGVANGYKELPPDIGDLSELKRFDVRCNYLVTLPPEIGNLKELRGFMADNNRIEYLPSEIGDLESLMEFRISHNNLSTLPSSIENLKNLRMFYISHNQLEELPESISGVSSLIELDLNYNHLENLPEGFAFNQLVCLLIAHNRFSNFPSAISNLPSLTEINLSSNQISQIEGEIFVNLSSLQKLNLNVNKLTHLPNQITNMERLQFLELADNHLESLPDDIGNLPNLTFLNLSHNRLKTLPFSITQLTKLQKLYVSFNQLENFEWDEQFSQLVELFEFTAGGNNLTFIPPFLFEIPSLKLIDLTSNEISEIPIAISKLTALESLLLSKNAISEVPEELASLSVLTEIDFSHNIISHIPEALLALNSLVDVDLSFNQIIELSSPHRTNAILQLKIAHNQMIKVPKLLCNWISCERNQLTKLPSKKKKDGAKFDPLPVKLPSKMENENHSSDFEYRFGWSETRGRRPDQQDTITVIPNFFNRNAHHFVGLYDGHGGTDSAEFVATFLHYVFEEHFSTMEEEKFDADRLFLNVFQTMQSEVKKRELADGTAANVTFITGNKLYVANAGDARTVLYRNGAALALSEDHKPDNHNERLRIEEAGGFVTEANRVNGVLALSRAIGDCDLQPPLICDPLVTETTITENDSLLIIGCDGLWDMISNDYACEMAQQYDDPTKAASALRDYAFSLGSSDNISVVVIKISPLLS